MAKKLLLLPLAALILSTLFACHNSTLLFSNTKKEEPGLEILSLDDGVFLKGGELVSFELSTEKTIDEKTLEMEITLSSSDGKVEWSEKITGPSLNREQEFLLPDLAEGRYVLVYTVFENGEVLEKKTTVFFATSKEYCIDGISSFPPVIRTSSKVLLAAELRVPEGEDPFLRWSAKGKVIKTGKWSDGLDRILWAAPSKKGVYPIRLELFPAPPEEGEDFSFTSSCFLTADVFVTQEAWLAAGDLAPQDSYYSLYHMAAELTDDGSAARKIDRSEPKILGAPQIVTVEDGFGFLLDGQSGFQFPWLLVPVEGGFLKPFTIHMGLQWDYGTRMETAAEDAEEDAGETAPAKTILSVKAENDAFTLVLKEDVKTRLPLAALSLAGVTVEIPSGFSSPAADRRTLLSLSVVAEEKSVTFLWFQDGQRKAVQTVQAEIKALRNSGVSTVGGANGFAGVIDELGIYYRDPDGRYTTDPTMFSMAARAVHGKQAALAEGFDGLFLAEGFTLEGEGVLSGGRLTLPPEGRLTLPALSAGENELEVTLEFALPEDAAKGALVSLSALDSTEPILALPIAPGTEFFRLTLTGESATYADAEGKEASASFQKTESLILSVVNPKERETPLQMESALVLRRGREQVPAQAEEGSPDPKAEADDGAKQAAAPGPARSRRR